MSVEFWEHGINYGDGRRTYWCKSVEGDAQEDYGTPKWNQGPLLDPEATGHEANLVSSALEGSPKHKPCLDIDIPCLKVDSSTEGHSHLYFDVELEWEQYKELLIVLAKCGIADPAWVKHSLDRQQSMLRPPGVRKASIEEMVERYRAELVELEYTVEEVMEACEFHHLRLVLGGRKRKNATIQTWADIDNAMKWEQENGGKF